MPLPLFDVQEIIAIHDEACTAAVRVQERSMQRADAGAAHRVAVSALSILAHDSICLHRAIHSLSLAGWAFAAPILLRTLLDALLSVAVITRSARPNVAAFKFLYAGARPALQDPASTPALAAEARANISVHRSQMTPEEQGEADSYLIASPAGAYWYTGDFRGPSDIIDRYAPTFGDLYRDLSSPTHAGFTGMRMFRDEPDRQNVNPRRDPRAHGFALYASSRFLTEMTQMRAAFEAVDAPEAEAVARRLAACRPIG